MDALKTCPLCGTENASDAFYCKMDRHPFQESELSPSQVPSPELSSKFKKSFFPLRNSGKRLFKSKPRKIDSELNPVNPKILEKGADESYVQGKITETAEGEISPSILSRGQKDPDWVPEKTLDSTGRTDSPAEVSTIIGKKKIPETPILSEPEDEQSDQAKIIYWDEDTKPRLFQQEEETKLGTYPKEITLNSEATEDFQITEVIKSADDEALTKPAKKMRWLWTATTVASLLLLFTIGYWYYPNIPIFKKALFFSFLPSGDKKETVSPQVPMVSGSSQKTMSPVPLREQSDTERPPIAIKMPGEDKNIPGRVLDTPTAENKMLTPRSSIANTNKAQKKSAVKEAKKFKNSAKSKDEILSRNDQIGMKPSEITPNTSREQQDTLVDQVNRALKKEGVKGITAIAGNDHSIIVKGAVKSRETKKTAIELARSLAGDIKVKDLIFLVQP